MKEVYHFGKYLFAIAIIAFAIIQFVTGNFMSGFLPVPDHFPARSFFLYLTCLLFLAGGISLLVFDSGTAALLLGLLFIFLLIYPHLASLIPDIHNGGTWAAFAETLAFCGGAIIIGTDNTTNRDPKRIRPRLKKWQRAGQLIIAASILIFAVQHFYYADYISALIPEWIPGKVFLTYFVGAAFLLTAISIIIKIKTRLACTLIGFMFLFWFIFLHAFRVFKSPHVEPEWTSALVALGFCGIFFTLAGQFSSIAVSPARPSAKSKKK